MKNFLFLFLALFSFNLYGWWDTGHMAVAKIAYQRLKPEVQEEVDRLICHFASSFPESSDFVTASCWLDDVSNQGLKALATWHGSAYPYDPTHVLSSKEKANIIRSREGKNCIFAIEECVKTLSDSKASLWPKALMLRVLIHVVGDVHQPLHCTTFYSADFPQGDKAGTRFPIQWEGQEKKNLHAFWDSMCGLGLVRLERPLDWAQESSINLLVEELTSLYPEQLFPELDTMDFDQWREESYRLGATVVYQGINPGEAPSENYIAKGQEMAGKRITLAGYRLAKLLNAVFSSQEKRAVGQSD